MSKLCCKAGAEGASIVQRRDGISRAGARLQHQMCIMMLKLCQIMANLQRL